MPAQVRCGRDGAACAREVGGPLDLVRDERIRHVDRQSEVPSSFLGIVGHRGDRGVDPVAVGAGRVRIDRGPVERMDEADLAAADPDQRCRLRLFEDLVACEIWEHRCEERDRRTSGRGRDEQHLRSGGREVRDATPDQVLAQAARHGQRQSRGPLVIAPHRTPELNGEEGIPARLPVDLAHRGGRHARPGVAPHDRRDRVEVERPERDPSRLRRRTLELSRLRRVDRSPPREEEPHGAPLESPHGVCERPIRLGVGPRDIVDREEDRTLLRRCPEDAQGRGGDGALVDCRSRRLLEQSHPERVPLRRGEAVVDLHDERPDQIAEDPEWQVGVGLSRRGAQHPAAAGSRGFEPRLPDGCLADAWFPVDEQGRRPPVPGRDEGGHGGLFLLTADDHDASRGVRGSPHPPDLAVAGQPCLPGFPPLRVGGTTCRCNPRFDRGRSSPVTGSIA